MDDSEHRSYLSKSAWRWSALAWALLVISWSIFATLSILGQRRSLAAHREAQGALLSLGGSLHALEESWNSDGYQRAYDDSLARLASAAAISESQRLTGSLKNIQVTLARMRDLRSQAGQDAIFQQLSSEVNAEYHTASGFAQQDFDETLTGLDRAWKRVSFVVVLCALMSLGLAFFVSLYQSVFIQYERSQSALRRTQERYREMFENASDIIFTTDLDGRTTSLNRAGQKVFGRRGDERFNFADCMTAKQAELSRRMQDRKLIGGGPTCYEIVIQSTDGRDVPLEVSSRLIYADGKPIEVQVIARDLTERKKAEEERRKLVSVVESSDSLIVMADPATGKIIYFNQAGCKLVGLDRPEQALGTHSSSYHAEGAWDKIEAECVSAMVQTGRWEGETQLLNFKTGKIIDVHVNMFVVRRPDGDAPLCLAAFARDITEVKRAEQALRESEERFRLIAETVEQVFWIVNPQSAERLYVSPAYESIWGRSREDLAGKHLFYSLLETIHPEDRDHARAMYAQLKEQQKLEWEYRILRPDGEVRWIRDRVLPAFDETGNLIRLVGTSLDITKYQQARSALEASEQRYALAAQGANDGLWDWDLKTGAVYYSVRWKAMLGFEEQEIGDHQQEWFERIHPDDVASSRKAIQLHLEGQEPHFQVEHRVLCKDGTYRWMLSRGIAVRDANGRPARMAGSQTDITDRKLAEERLVHDAFHDALTGLPNRALLNERLERKVARSERHPEQLFAVLFLDLDGFKAVNDSLGHAVGDHLLIAVARRMESCLRPDDTLVRLGGDEFVILTGDLKAPQDAVEIAGRIQGAIQAPFLLDSLTVSIGASIGIALSSLDFEFAENLLRYADTAMYRAKVRGKGRCEVFRPPIREKTLAPRIVA